MKTKRLLALVLSMLMLLPFALSACDGGNAETTVAPDPTSAPVESEQTPAVTDEVTEVTTDEATTAEETTAEEIKTNEPPQSIKILAIGNSFSTDCMQYLYQILKDGGVKEIVLGNLYYGGCSIDQHYQFGTKDSASYKYYKNTTGTWKLTENYKMSAALTDETWDYISFQQTSKTCGLTNSYSKLDELVALATAKNPQAKLIWNMTWAYQQDSTHSSFPNYNKDQMTMYNMIINVVNEIITPMNFDIMIPCMTSIQNARTSFMGDTLTRDGYHMDNYIGRYIVGLTWYAAITGCSVDGITFNPSTAKINAEMIAAAKEAVTEAIKTPLAVTQSTITTGTRPGGSTPVDDPTITIDPADFIEADTALAAQNSVDLSKYTLLDWDYVENAYWYCTKYVDIYKPASSNGTYQQNICCDRKYSISELPVGTIFIVDSGWQYRLEIYDKENAKYTGTRPGMTTQNFFVLTDAYLKGCQFVAWNIASSPKSNISQLYAQAACHLRIYVPNGQ